MRIKILMITVSLALFFLALPQNARAQEDGEAQAVIFDANDRPTLKFTNKSAKKQRCGALVSYTLMENQEEAIVLRAAHMHVGSLGWKPTLPETGWLYITPSRITFKVEVGDPSHAIDIPRTELMDKAVKRLGGKIFISDLVGIKINLKEKLAASNSSEQKFVFFIAGERCDHIYPAPYSKFIERAGNDFNGTAAEFKRLVDSLKQSGRSRKISAYLVPPLNTRDLNAAPDGKAAPPVVVSPEPGREGFGDVGVNLQTPPERKSTQTAN